MDDAPVPDEPDDPDDPAPQPGAPEASLDDVLLAAVDRCPHTGYGLARHVERYWPGYLKEREGFLYPVLLELWRAGRVDAVWADLPQGRRRVYRSPRTAGPVEGVTVSGARLEPVTRRAHDLDAATAEVRTSSSDTWRRAFDEVARECTKSLRFAPRLAEEFHAELTGHLADAAADYTDLGRSDADAEARAIRDLGDTWRIRIDLRRAAQGHRTVVFPSTVFEGLHGIAIYDLRVLVVIVAVIIFVRVQVVTAYHIPSRSMEPTLHGDQDDGDRILVNKWCGPIERFDIVVFDGWGSDRKNYIKRTIGLPGERLEIYGGNLWIDGHLIRKRGAPYEAMLFPVFRADAERALAVRVADGDPVAELRSQMHERWRGDTGVWRLDVPDLDHVTFSAEAGDEPATLLFDDGGSIRDGVWDEHDASSDGGSELVSDLRVAVRIVPTAERTRAGLRLTRGDETYEATLGDDGHGLEVRVDGAVVLSDPSFELPPGGATLRFAQVDLVLRVDVDGRAAQEFELDAPAFPKRESPRGEVRAVISQGAATVTPVSVERDIHWTSGDYDDRTSVTLRDDEYFMLGDNSSNSRDSRANGPVHATRLVGKPMLVVWPPNRAFHVPR